MKRYALLPMLLLSAGLLQTQAAAAEQTAATRQDAGAVRQIVEQFLRTQTAGLPGQVNISVHPLDSRTNLAACAAPEAFLPGGGRAWGKTTVGVRCTVPVNWTVYVSATVQVISEYLATAAPLAQGQVIGTNDVIKMKGDLTLLPAAILTDISQAVGRTAAVSLATGTPLRQDALRQQQAVQQGQAVRLVTNGPGFSVASEGRALNNGAEGQVVQARTAGGQVISGIAKAGGVVEISY
jgi:flagella basal body P-ring formation protein FlgA